MCSEAVDAQCGLDDLVWASEFCSGSECFHALSCLRAALFEVVLDRSGFCVVRCYEDDDGDEDAEDDHDGYDFEEL